MALTWKDVASIYPEFVQWAVAKYGPLPDGPIQEERYKSLSIEYITNVAPD